MGNLNQSNLESIKKAAKATSEAHANLVQILDALPTGSDISGDTHNAIEALLSSMQELEAAEDSYSRKSGN